MCWIWVLRKISWNLIFCKKLWLVLRWLQLTNGCHSLRSGGYVINPQYAWDAWELCGYGYIRCAGTCCWCLIITCKKLLDIDRMCWTVCICVSLSSISIWQRIMHFCGKDGIYGISTESAGIKNIRNIFNFTEKCWMGCFVKKMDFT